MTIRFKTLTSIGAVLLCLSTAAGCSTVATDLPTQAPQKMVQKACTNQITMQGRISFNYTLEGEPEGMHGKFSWEQTPQQTVITLRSPLGQTLAKVEILPEISTFSMPGRAPKSAANVQELIASSLGWDLPVIGMQTWLQGCAVDKNGENIVATPENEHIDTYQGWHIDYLDWTDYKGHMLPRRINLSKKKVDDQSLDVEIRLVVDEWQI